MSKKYIGAAVVPTVTASDTTAPDAATGPAAVPSAPGTVVTTPVPTLITDFLARSEKEKHVTFLLPQMMPEDLLLKLQLLKDEDRKALQDQIKTLTTRLEKEKLRNERFRKEANQINKNWERKFFILRNSFHVLKDEMFTRHTLFRQFAMIADTSFNYIKVKPLYVHSTMHMSESSSPTNVFHSPMMEHKFVDIPSDQVTYTHLPKVRSFASQKEGLEKELMAHHIPVRRADPRN